MDFGRKQTWFVRMNLSVTVRFVIVIITPFQFVLKNAKQVLHVRRRVTVIVSCIKMIVCPKTLSKHLKILTENAARTPHIKCFQ